MKGSIRRRSKDSWQLTIDLGRGADGKRLRKFVTVQGKKAEADRRLRELLARADKGLPMDESHVTVGQWLAEWLGSYAAPHVSPRTLARSSADVKLHLTPALGHVRLVQLRAAEIQRLEAGMLAAGKAPRTVRHTHAVLRAALRRAVRLGLLFANPIDAAVAPRIPHSEIRTPSAEEVLQLLDAARGTPYGPVLTFLARTGVRRGEALALRWEGVDWATRTAQIVGSLQRLPNGCGVVVTAPKSARSRRAVALDDATVDMLREHQGRQLLVKAELANAYHDAGFVFPAEDGRPLNPDTLSKAFPGLVRAVGLPPMRLDDLRHAHASIMLAAGADLVTVSRRLGHSWIAITADTYGHISAALQRAAADAFQGAMERARMSAP